MSVRTTDPAGLPTRPDGTTAWPAPRTGGAVQGWLAGAVSVLVVAGLTTLLLLRNSRYFFIDDRQADALPKLIDIGRQLRDGHFPWITTEVVNSGGHAVEYQNAIFNPLNLLLSTFLAGTDDPALGSYVYYLVHAVLLTAAAAWLGRRLRLSAGWTVAFAVSVGSQPYTFVWGGAWYQVITAFTWFVLAVAAAVAFHQTPRRRYGWVLVLATYCCFTSGWPLAIPFLGVVVLVLLVSRWRLGEPLRDTIWLGAYALGGALASAVALFPLTRSFEFATRTSGILNDSNFNVVPLEALLHFADPTFYAWFNNFGGYARQDLPHSYVAWFVLPVLVLLARRPTDRRVLAVLVTAGAAVAIAGLGALGPERVLVFRFPTRFLQYFGFFLLVGTAVLVASGRFSFTRRRLHVLLGAVLLLAATSVQTDPHGARRVLPVLLVVAALCAAVWWLGRRLDDGSIGPLTGRGGMDAVVALGTVVLLAWTVHAHPDGRGLDWGFPDDLRTLDRVSLEDYTLFYGNYPPVPASPETYAEYYAEFRPSSTGLYLGDRTVNGYSPLGHEAFRERFPLDDQGNAAEPDASGFTEVDEQTGLTWLELLRVDQVVALNGQWDEQLATALDEPWERTGVGTVTSVYRGPEYDLPGLLSYVPEGTTVAAVGGEDCARAARECAQVSVGGDEPARLVFARLWFPGYRATLDGEPVEVSRHGDLLVAVDLPAGADGRLVLEYGSPGFRPLAAMALAVVLVLAVAGLLVPLSPVLRARSRQRGRSGVPAEAPPPA